MTRKERKGMKKGGGGTERNKMESKGKKRQVNGKDSQVKEIKGKGRKGKDSKAGTRTKVQGNKRVGGKERS